MKRDSQWEMIFAVVKCTSAKQSLWKKWVNTGPTWEEKKTNFFNEPTLFQNDCTAFTHFKTVCSLTHS